MTAFADGTLPVFFLIAPTCAAGAFQLKVGEGGNWKSLADTMLSVAGLVQAMALCAGEGGFERLRASLLDAAV